jgi:hypothetical protein
MPDPRETFGEPLGPWTRQHTLGVAALAMIAAALGASIWPGWGWIRAWLGGL